MKKAFIILAIICTAFSCAAQLPPSNMYDNLGVYESEKVFRNGVQIPFNGTDYFFLDFDNSGDVWVLFNDSTEGWMTTSADFEEEGEDYTKYSVTNPAGEDLVFIISPDRQDIVVAKEGDDITIAYALINGGNNSTRSYGSYNNYGGNSGGSYGNSNAGGYNNYGSSRQSGGSSGFSLSEQTAYNRDKKTYERYDSQLSSHFAGNQTMSPSSVRNAQQSMKSLRTKWENRGKSFPRSVNESR